VGVEKRECLREYWPRRINGYCTVDASTALTRSRSKQKRKVKPQTRVWHPHDLYPSALLLGTAQWILGTAATTPKT
jgi:hypothetical protein